MRHSSLHLYGSFTIFVDLSHDDDTQPFVAVHHSTIFYSSVEGQRFKNLVDGFASHLGGVTQFDKQPLKFIRRRIFRQQNLNGGNANYCCRSTPWCPMAGQADEYSVAKSYKRPLQSITCRWMVAATNDSNGHLPAQPHHFPTRRDSLPKRIQ
jgi:hypothetical protein